MGHANHAVTGELKAGVADSVVLEGGPGAVEGVPPGGADVGTGRGAMTGRARTGRRRNGPDAYDRA